MADVWKLYERATGALVQEFDVSGKNAAEKDKVFDGMVFKIDFERFKLDMGEES